MSNNEPLSFDVPPEQDVEISHSSRAEKQPTQQNIDNYRNLPPPQRRLKILYGIKNGEISLEDNFPSCLHSHLKNFASLIVTSKYDGRLVTDPTVAPNTQAGRLKPKVDRFIMMGTSGDLIDASNNKMWTDIINAAVKEIEPKLNNDHPSAKFKSLDKKGELDEIINHYMRINNLDLLFKIPTDFKDRLKTELLKARAKSSQEKRGILEETSSFIEDTRNKLRQILFS